MLLLVKRKKKKKMVFPYGYAVYKGRQWIVMEAFIRQSVQTLVCVCVFISLKRSVHQAADRITSCEVNLLDRESKSERSKAAVCRLRKYWSRDGAVSHRHTERAQLVAELTMTRYMLAHFG